MCGIDPLGPPASVASPVSGRNGSSPKPGNSDHDSRGRIDRSEVPLNRVSAFPRCTGGSPVSAMADQGTATRRRQERRAMDRGTKSKVRQRGERGVHRSAGLQRKPHSTWERGRPVRKSTSEALRKTHRRHPRPRARHQCAGRLRVESPGTPATPSPPRLAEPIADPPTGGAPIAARPRRLGIANHDRTAHH